MSKRAFDKIATGLNEAVAIARGEETPARLLPANQDSAFHVSSGLADPARWPAAMKHPVTPDGRYFVVRGRLWRCMNPALSDAERETLTRELMDARRSIGHLKRKGADLSKARAAVDRAKVALGERGPVWWADGAPDYNRRMARNTPYAEWFTSVDGAEP